MEQQRETFNEKPVYSLTEISKSLRSVISKSYPNAYYIKAEIVRLNYYPHSGHCYPELAEKEGNQIKTQMRAIIWAAQFREINERFRKITGEPMKDGINILCLATIEYDVKYGLSLHIQNIEPTYTLGDMVKNRLLVIERLKKEGIFAANKNKKLPLVPKRIAVISVETSKGYGDFMVTLEKNPYAYRFNCTLFPSILQGEKAVATITARLAEIQKRLSDFDCVVIIRGGGGDVGLSCYDDYTLAAAVATFPLPVISGIGHSTNETVTDMVSYQSKITPTDVANFFIEQYRLFDEQIEDCKQSIYRHTHALLVAQKSELLQMDHDLYTVASKVVVYYRRQLQHVESEKQLVLHKRLNQEKNQIDQWKYKMELSLSKLVAPQKEQITNLEQMANIWAKQIVKKQKKELATIEDKIILLHPDHILKRGFSITYLNEKALTDQAEVKSKDVIVTKLFNGEITSIVE